MILQVLGSNDGVNFFPCAGVADAEAADGYCTLFIQKGKVFLQKDFGFFSIVVLARSEKDRSKLSFLLNDQLSDTRQLHRGCA